MSIPSHPATSSLPANLSLTGTVYVPVPNGVNVRDRVGVLWGVGGRIDAEHPRLVAAAPG